MKKISFVFQGPVTRVNNDDITISCLRRARSLFKNAEIIFSTWENQVLSPGYEDFLVVKSPDPGSGFRDRKNGIFNNINRQIISSRAGLEQASGELAVKVRSDILFTHSNLFDHFSKFNRFDENFRFVKERILVTNITSVNPHKKQKLLFHPCDWIYVGDKTDLLSLFYIPLFPDDEDALWFERHERSKFMPFETVSARYAAESYIWVFFLKKHLAVNFDHQADFSSGNLLLSEKTLANNLVICNNKMLGIRNLKTDLGLHYRYFMYTHHEWKKLYHRYSEFSKRGLLSPDRDRITSNLYYFLYRIKARVANNHLHGR